MVVASSCSGCLVVHRDGLVAFCTEELDGGHCAGYDHHHLAGVMPCRVAPLVVRCWHCQQVTQLRLMLAEPFVPRLPERDSVLAN